MIADRCEINRQIRADNKMLRELKAQVKKFAQAVEKSIPVIAETLEAIRNHMIFTQYHLLHNEMQKEVIHDWMQHFRPILNQYDTIKKKLKAKVTEKKELNVQKSKTSILNPFQHIKLNQQLTTVTEEIEELKSVKEQLLFQAECSTEKDMASFPENTTRWIRIWIFSILKICLSKGSLKKMLSLSKRKNSVLTRSNTLNYWMPESRYDLLPR